MKRLSVIKYVQICSAQNVKELKLDTLYRLPGQETMGFQYIFPGFTGQS